MFKSIITAIALIATTATASFATEIQDLDYRDLTTSVNSEFKDSNDVASRTWTLKGITINGEDYIKFAHYIGLRGGSTEVYSTNFDDSIRYVVREAYKRGWAAAQEGEDNSIRVTSSRSQKKYEAHQASHSVYIASVTFNGDKFTTRDDHRQRYLTKDNKNLNKIKKTYEKAAEAAYQLGHADALESVN